MRAQRVLHRSRQATPVIAATCAFADVVVEATKRGLRRNPRTTPAEAAQASATGQVFRLLGRELRHRRRLMLDADDRYQELRSRQRRLRLERDQIARRAYRGLVAARKVLKGLFGYEGACDFLGLRGPTRREPRDLNYQLGEAVWWARNHEAEVDPLHVGAEEEAESCVASLELLHADLGRSLGDVLRGWRQTTAAMLEQRAAMAEFDETSKHVAGTLEAQLIAVGLPTLAAAVRPGVGRRGRPLKRPPVDRHPDLVEQVRARGLIEAHSTSSKLSGNDSELEPTAQNAAGLGDAVDVELSNRVRSDSAHVEIIEQPLPQRSRGDEKAEKPFHKRSGDEAIIEQALPERSGAEEKSRHLVRKQTGSDSKIEQPLRKSGNGEASVVMSRLTLSPPASACGRGVRPHDHGGCSYRVERRVGGPAAGRPSLKRMRKAAASWWERLLRAA